MSTPTNQSLTDVQASADARQIPINRVGVKDVTYPVCLKMPDGGVQHTVAKVDMYVSLPHHQKGTHMSRFLQVLHRHATEIDPSDIRSICHDIRETLGAEEAHLTISFVYFINKKAPATQTPGLMDYEVTFEVVSTATHDDMILGVRVPATSLCPCSKIISEYGAHNQRCLIGAQVRTSEVIWIEELVTLVESIASAPVYSVLKRPDEKFVTEQAYDQPKFVEDIVRDLAIQLEQDDRIGWYAVSSENFESIHNHSAYAVIEKDKTNG